MPKTSTSKQLSTKTNQYTKDNLLKSLEMLRRNIGQDPLANPVRQVGFDLSQSIEFGDVKIAQLSNLVQQLSDDGFEKRAERLKHYLTGPSLKALVATTSKSFKSFAAFRNHWEHTANTIVFTGHPTFMMPEATRHALADRVIGKSTPIKNLAHIRDEGITLRDEHDAVMDCANNAAHACSALNKELFLYAQENFPQQWRSLRPMAFTFASWVGYDMDGRNDISWRNVIHHRLLEKQIRLAYYRSEFQRLGKRYKLQSEKLFTTTLEKISAAKKQTDTCVTAFADELAYFGEITAAGNIVTKEDPGKLTNLDDIIAALYQIAANSEDNAALEISVLASEMSTLGLGAGAIHFRLNASQIRNAIRQELDLPDDADLFGRTTLQTVCSLVEKVKPVSVNFASLAIEQTTAARIAIAIAQIIKHIDASSPIRLLIAECETPVTVLSAMYFVRRFGIDAHVDVCPLLETEAALERAERLLDRLFKQKIYRTLIRKRGCLSIEAGFSDAGRFMGQIPAALAIERVHVQLADLMSKHRLTDVRAIIFDTHGESMGRGAHPSTITDRCLYAMSPLVRHRFQEHGIALTHETSFQGGDGYVFFANQKIALKTLCGVLQAENVAADTPTQNDPFYRDVTTSLDFYYKVKARQEALYADKAYHITVSALGLSMLPPTGSRKSRRQFERHGDDDASLRRIRAIPHNAALQQLCFLANVTEGVGEAIGTDIDDFALLYKESDRFRRIMGLVSPAFELSEIKTLIGYLRVYDGSFWGTRPLARSNDMLDRASAQLALTLADDPRYAAALQLAARMRPSILTLGKLLNRLGLRETIASSVPLELDLLHAIRVALIEHLFLLAAQLPSFAPTTGWSRQDLMEMVFDLRIPEATAILRDSFPTETAGADDFAMDEKATYPTDKLPQYRWVTERLVEPMEESYALILRISAGIAHFYGAIG